MPKFAPLILYSTTNCHLCEQAHTILEAIPELKNYNVVDIIDSDTLLASYGTRIPVLVRTDSQQSLDWPFDQNAIREFAILA